MKEYLFRIWDKKNKYMIYPGDCPEVDPKNCGNLIYCDMETIAIGLDGTLYLIDECGNYEYADKEQYIPMQCTCRNDKNDKMIFRGDIVKKHETNPNLKQYDGALGVIKYNLAHMGFEIDLIKGDECSFYYPNGDNWQSNQLEIVGNIYETPELLECLELNYIPGTSILIGNIHEAPELLEDKERMKDGKKNKDD